MRPTSRYGTKLNQAFGKFLIFVTDPPSGRISLIVIPKSVKARVSIEAGVKIGWSDLIGESGIAISIDTFGASASASVLFKEFGFTVEKVKQAVKNSIAKTKA